MGLLRIALAIFLSLRLLGGDGAALQVVAWAGMIVSRAPDQGLAAAVESTFDGKHPCPLCKALEAAEKPPAQDSRIPESLVIKLKLKDAVVSPRIELAAAESPGGTKQPRIRTRDARADARRDAPETPPPESALLSVA